MVQTAQGKSGYFSKGGPMERADYERIKIPYKERKKATWPKAARLAVSFYIAAEYWEEGMGQEHDPIKRGPDWMSISQRSWYNFECGIFRSMEMFDKYGVKVSGLVSGLAAEYYPEIIKELAERGHEIAAHEWDQNLGSWKMTREEERESVRRTTRMVEKASGARPVGWINPGARPTSDTVEFLAAENYLWHGDLRDDDIPYGIRYNGKVLIRIPHCNLTHNDFSYFGLGGVGDFKFSPRTAVEYVKETLDAYVERSKEELLMMQLGNHPFVGSHPDRLVALDRILTYVKSLPGVWICTYKDIAEYWKNTYIS